MDLSKVDRGKYRWIAYTFTFPDGRPDLEFIVLLDRETLIALPPEGSVEREWTKLEFCKCSICPLTSVANCPIAFNISGVIEAFSPSHSFDQVEIRVEVEERTYLKRDSIQEGLRSILGIFMAASGCPHMDLLKPMVRFHLPFASIEETVFRHVTNYLLSRYFECSGGKGHDVDLARLGIKNDDVDIVNRGIYDRIRDITRSDANKNALIILNTLGKLLQLEIEENLKQLQYLYHPPEKS